MNLLLGFIASVGLTSPSVATIANNSNLNNIIVLNENDQEKIVLTKIKTKNTVSNMNWTTESTTEQEISDSIIMDLMSSNTDDEIILAVLMDVFYYPENWIMIGFPIPVPEPNTKINRKLKFMAGLDNPSYTGFLLFDVDIINEEESKELENAVKSKNLGIIENPTQEKVLNKFFKDNSNIQRTDVTVKELNYKTLLLEASSTSKYIGRVLVTYYAKVKLYETWESEKIEVEAYNSTQTDSRHYQVEYRPEFGVDYFQQKFKKMDLTYSGEYKIKNYNEDNWTNVKQTTESMSLSNGMTNDLWNDGYFGSVNWNTTKAWTSIKMENNVITINFDIEVKAYASWMNAYWSRAGAQLNIKNIEFS
ncbi:hypothetical protein [Spiroplasma endosymbiont of Dioctria linearis]|uniref:hypothetical protein n=1 Tax=Spiroplasma endosymbiont of Dioctria linearis TaxID=3066290 RepID=UPI00313E9DFF